MKFTHAHLEDHLGFWLRFVSNHVSGGFRERIAEHDVTVAEWVVLRTLFTTSPLKLNELSERVGVDTGAISRLVDKLIKKKLITRKMVSRDRRSVAITLTDVGEKLVPKLAQLADQNDEFYFSKISKSDRAELKRILQKLVEQHELTEKPLS